MPRNYSELDSSLESGYRFFETNGRMELNNLLWRLMPDSMTLGELDIVSNDIINIMEKAWDGELKKKKKSLDGEVATEDK